MFEKRISSIFEKCIRIRFVFIYFSRDREDAFLAASTVQFALKAKAIIARRPEIHQSSSEYVGAPAMHMSTGTTDDDDADDVAQCKIKCNCAPIQYFSGRSSIPAPPPGRQRHDGRTNA